MFVLLFAMLSEHPRLINLTNWAFKVSQLKKTKMYHSYLLVPPVSPFLLLLRPNVPFLPFLVLYYTDNLLFITK